MTKQEQFQAYYIGKHLHKSLESGEYTYRDLQKYLADDWMGHKYSTADIENSWQQFQREIEQ